MIYEFMARHRSYTHNLSSCVYNCDNHWDPRLVVAHVLRGSPRLACHLPTSDMETNGFLSSPWDG